LAYTTAGPYTAQPTAQPQAHRSLAPRVEG